MFDGLLEVQMSVQLKCTTTLFKIITHELNIMFTWYTYLVIEKPVNHRDFELIGSFQEGGATLKENRLGHFRQSYPRLFILNKQSHLNIILRWFICGSSVLVLLNIEYLLNRQSIWMKFSKTIWEVFDLRPPRPNGLPFCLVYVFSQLVAHLLNSSLGLITNYFDKIDCCYAG